MMKPINLYNSFSPIHAHLSLEDLPISILQKSDDYLRSDEFIFIA